MDSMNTSIDSLQTGQWNLSWEYHQSLIGSLTLCSSSHTNFYRVAQWPPNQTPPLHLSILPNQRLLFSIKLKHISKFQLFNARKELENSKESRWITYGIRSTLSTVPTSRVNFLKMLARVELWSCDEWKDEWNQAKRWRRLRVRCLSWMSIPLSNDELDELETTN